MKGYNRISLAVLSVLLICLCSYIQILAKENSLDSQMEYQLMGEVELTVDPEQNYSRRLWLRGDYLIVENTNERNDASFADIYDMRSGFPEYFGRIDCDIDPIRSRTESDNYLFHVYKHAYSLADETPCTFPAMSWNFSNGNVDGVQLANDIESYVGADGYLNGEHLHLFTYRNAGSIYSGLPCPADYLVVDVAESFPETVYRLPEMTGYFCSIQKTVMSANEDTIRLGSFHTFTGETSNHYGLIDIQDSMNPELVAETEEAVGSDWFGYVYYVDFDYAEHDGRMYILRREFLDGEETYHVDVYEYQTGLSLEPTFVSRIELPNSTSYHKRISLSYPKLYVNSGDGLIVMDVNDPRNVTEIDIVEEVTFGDYIGVDDKIYYIDDSTLKIYSNFDFSSFTEKMFMPFTAAP